MSMMDKLEIGSIVKMANGNRPAIEQGGMPTVQDLVLRNDLVFGVWQDSAAPSGVATTIVKGKSRLLAIIKEQASETLSITAVPCTCAEQAEALKRVHGDSALS